MEAKELRIGNYVELNNTQFKIEKGVYYEVDFDKYIIDGYGFENFKPIPSTEEWLLKFGFTLHPWGWTLSGILIRFSNRKFWTELGNGKIIDLPYVHILQNFFQLAGEELNIIENEGNN